METKEFLTSLVETYGMTKRVNDPKNMGVRDDIKEFYTAAFTNDDDFNIALKTDCVWYNVGGNLKLIPLLRWFKIYRDTCDFLSIPDDPLIMLSVNNYDLLEGHFKKIEKIARVFNKRIEPFDYDALRTLCELCSAGNNIMGISIEVEWIGASRGYYVFGIYK